MPYTNTNLKRLSILEKLPDSLDQALRLIANGLHKGVPFEDVRKLLAAGFIRHSVNGGFIVNSIGKDYLVVFEQ